MRRFWTRHGICGSLFFTFRLEYEAKEEEKVKAAIKEMFIIKVFSYLNSHFILRCQFIVEVGQS